LGCVRPAAAFLDGLAFAKPSSRARRHGLSASPASESGSKLILVANGSGPEADPRRPAGVRKHSCVQRSR